MRDCELSAILHGKEGVPKRCWHWELVACVSHRCHKHGYHHGFGLGRGKTSRFIHSLVATVSTSLSTHESRGSSLVLQL